MGAVEKALCRADQRERKRRKGRNEDMVVHGRPPVVPEGRRAKISKRRRQAVFEQRR